MGRGGTRGPGAHKRAGYRDWSHQRTLEQGPQRDLEALTLAAKGRLGHPTMGRKTLHNVLAAVLVVNKGCTLEKGENSRMC